MNAQLELLGHRDLDLRVFARRPKDADALDATFRSDNRQLLLAGVLAGLREVGVFGELMPLAEQRLDVFLGEMDVVCRNFDEKRLLLLRFEDARDVRAASVRIALRAPSCVPRPLGTTRTATFESSVEMRLISSAARIAIARAVELTPMHSKPCNASARTTALPWPTPPVKITASSPPMDAT